MSIRAFTKDSTGLLARIKTLIDQGHITTWEYDSDGDFTHTPSQWKNKAWLQPEVQDDKLRLTIMGTTSGLSREVYAVYHGRFVEMLVAHVSDRFTTVSASPNAAAGDTSPS